MNFSLILSIRKSPAFETPPPITNISGSTVIAICARAIPRYFATISTTSIASLSPAFAASSTSLAVKSSISASLEVSFFFARSFFASLTIPVALDICSRQPLPPQLHFSVSDSLTCICPISPPSPCFPGTILPSVMMPPPTPVPSVTITTSLICLAPPIHASPSAATLASFPSATGIPSKRSERILAGNTSFQPIFTTTSI